MRTTTTTATITSPLTMHVRVDELSGAERVLLYGLALERLRALRVPLSARDLLARRPPPPALCTTHTSPVRISRSFSFTLRVSYIYCYTAALKNLCRTLHAYVRGLCTYYVSTVLVQCTVRTLLLASREQKRSQSWLVVVVLKGTTGPVASRPLTSRATAEKFSESWIESTITVGH